MKKSFFLIVVSFFLISCSVLKNDSKKALIEKTGVSGQECPNDGKCEIQFLENKSLKINRDDTNKIYYSLDDNSERSVIKFVFKKNNPLGFADANYSEEIVLEIQNSKKVINLSDEFLEKAKVLFVKHCFCRGQAGTYFVQSGILKIFQDKDIIDLELTFNMGGVSQEISRIKYKVQK